MNPEKLAELAERCEQASGPDRALDAYIYVTFFGMPYNRDIPAPAYSASLDVAVSLVPDQYKDDWLISGNTACLGPDSMYWSEGEADFYVRAATPALALVAASLRSLASRGGTEG